MDTGASLEKSARRAAETSRRRLLQPRPPPPAVITPGTPQNDLANAQDNARNNPAFAPQGERGTPERKTFCNMATCSILRTYGGPMDALTNQVAQPGMPVGAA